MGHQQSQIITDKSVEDDQNPRSSGAEAGYTPKSSESKTDEKSKKYELAVSNNTAAAKTWNPDDPKSWEPEMREYNSLPNGDYLLPSDTAERDRLEIQSYILRAAFRGDIVCPAVKELANTPGYKILDVGCANGFWLKCVKKDNPVVECHGVDILNTLIEEACETDGVIMQFGNVLETLPYEDNTFDFVHQRLVFGGVPRVKYPDALKELIRVTKPGGWIELVEGDGLIYNPGPYSKTFSTALSEGFHRLGRDCYAATNLPWYVKQVSKNAENEQNIMLHLSTGWGSKVGVLLGADVKAVYLGMEESMHKAMGFSREQYRDLVHACYVEWAEYKSFVQIRALYFQVKK
ncbi:hypothetical protein HK100_003738 [Physocladia obscura]|uniref:S-adenosyl-L-methionine-dependent methyltransferase n=1 Tax=Physocladia obscura TaxID=109957 RepID=A0AAD5SWA5_9FUNG|nr:hypothetical protein HK100_003738 [Physocladia obscura]